MVDAVKTNHDNILHFAGSALFFKLFDETIQLIQEASFYLEGAGRVDVSSFPFKASQVYNVQSIQLTNRLMEVSSWLLAHRSYYRGETKALKQIPLKNASGSDELDEEVLTHLPIRMCALIQKSKMLHCRVGRLNEQLHHKSNVVPPVRQERPQLQLVTNTPSHDDEEFYIL